MSRYDVLMERILRALNMTAQAPSAMGWTRPRASIRTTSRTGRDKQDVTPKCVFCGALGDHTVRDKLTGQTTGRKTCPWDFEARYNSCRTDESRRLVINDALERLRATRYAKRAADIRHGTREDRLNVGRDPRHVSIVAHVTGYSQSHVYRLRAEARVEDAKHAQVVR